MNFSKAATPDQSDVGDVFLPFLQTYEGSLHPHGEYTKVLRHPSTGAARLLAAGTLHKANSTAQ